MRKKYWESFRRRFPELNPSDKPDFGSTIKFIIRCDKCGEEYDSVQVPITEHLKHCSANPPVIKSVDT